MCSASWERMQLCWMARTCSHTMSLTFKQSEPDADLHYYILCQRPKSIGFSWAWMQAFAA
jgi:hypothetical protein